MILVAAAATIILFQRLTGVFSYNSILRDFHRWLLVAAFEVRKITALTW